MQLVNPTMSTPSPAPDPAPSTRTPSSPPGSGLLRLLYSSIATSDLNTHEMETLLGVCRTLNHAHDITGVLIHLHAPEPGTGFFLQLLEGPHEAVEATYAKIVRDELHHSVTLLSTATASNRQFGAWSMALREVDSQQTVQLHATLARPTPTTALPLLSEWITNSPAMELLLIQAA